MDNEKPSFYSFLTADVRYDPRLKNHADEKVLFSEITALSNKYGFCNASNGYFAKNYERPKQTISKWINHLRELGYLKIKIIRDGKQIVGRKMYAITTPINANVDRGINVDVSRGINVDVKGNTTSLNTTSNNKKTLRQKHKKRVYDKDSDYYKLSEFFVKQILTNNPNFKNPNIQKWSDDFRKIIELDGRDKHQVAKLIVWVQHDSFWFSNILSPAKLRDKYDQLVMRMSPSISEQRGSNSKEHISNKENDLKDKLKKEAEKKIKENEKENAARRTRIMQGSAEQA